MPILEVSQVVGGGTVRSFNDNNTDIVSGVKKISRITLYRSGHNVVGIRIAFHPRPGGGAFPVITHGRLGGAGVINANVDVADNEYIKEAKITTFNDDNKIGHVSFATANAAGAEILVDGGLPALEGAAAARPHRVHQALGRIIAFHGTTRGNGADEVLESLGVTTHQPLPA